MSRFFTGGSSSEEESDSGSEKEETGEMRPGIAVPSKFAAGPGGSSSESEEDEPAKRVVRSARDKRFEELNNIIGQTKNHMKINDWNSIVNGMRKIERSCE